MSRSQLTWLDLFTSRTIGTFPEHGNVLRFEQWSLDLSVAPIHVSIFVRYWGFLGNGIIGDVKSRLALGQRSHAGLQWQAGTTVMSVGAVAFILILFYRSKVKQM